VVRSWLGLVRQSDDRSGPKDRLGRLAAKIEALSSKDNRLLHHAAEIAGLRRGAAAGLYRLCAEFAAEVNALMSQPELVVDPPDYGPDSFQEDGVNLIQINVRGRLLQLEFEATPGLLSTEDFRVPYTLEGSIRSFNQEWLDHDTIEEQLIFYCVERARTHWHFFDPRTYRSGPLDRDYLTFLMEQLI